MVCILFLSFPLKFVICHQLTLGSLQVDEAQSRGLLAISLFLVQF